MELLLSHDPGGRKYVLGRLDRDHIADLAEKAKIVLAADHAVELAYMPGDATWYSLIIAPVLFVIGAPGGGTGGYPTPSYIGAGEDTAYVIVHAQSEGAVWCSPADDMEWVAQKFDTTEASQLAIAELLKAVFDSQAAEKGVS